MFHFFQIWFQGENPGIEYSYTVAKETPPSQKPYIIQSQPPQRDEAAQSIVMQLDIVQSQPTLARRRPMISSRWSPPRVLKRHPGYRGGVLPPTTNRYRYRHRQYPRIYNQQNQFDNKRPPNPFDTRTNQYYRPPNLGSSVPQVRDQISNSRGQVGPNSRQHLPGSVRHASSSQVTQQRPLPVNKHTSRSIQMVERRYMEPVNHDMESVNHAMEPVNRDMQSVNHNMEPVNRDAESANRGTEIVNPGSEYDQDRDEQGLNPVVNDAQPSVLSPQISKTEDELTQSSAVGVWVKTGYTGCSATCGKGNDNASIISII